MSLYTVAYLRGGGLVRAPPPFGRTAVIFVTILGLFLASFRDKIAATSDQMRFFGRKMLQYAFAAGAPPRTPLEELTALPQRCQPVYC